MTGMISQIGSVTWLGLSSLPARRGSSLVVVIGVAMVVAVFISVLAIAAGFSRSMASAGRADRVIILPRGAESEATGELPREAVDKIGDLVHVRKSSRGEPILSAEAVAFVPFIDRGTGLESFVTLRGVGARGAQLRPEIRLVEGRMFKPGARELVVGRAVQKRFAQAAVGTTISLPEGDWPVVGVFESGGDARESEMLTDAETLITTYRRKGFNAVTLLLDDVAHFDTLKAEVGALPGLVLDVSREDEYVARRSSVVRKLLQVVAFGIGAIMAFGAAFGAVNTMFAAVGSRSSEIGTLRALGFGSGAVITSVLAEALVLALAGAAIGCAIAWLILSDTAVSTLTGSGPSQVTFELKLTGQVVALGILAALVIGAIGGLLPAMRAGTQSIVDALRK